MDFIEDYRFKVFKKFGTYPCSNSDICNECGKTYGEHQGYDCPEDEFELSLEKHQPFMD